VSVDLSEFVSGFLAEAADHLRNINANLLLVDTAISKQGANPRAVRELFRALHTMKGLAGMVGVEPIVEIAHAMERVVREAEQNGGKVPPQAFEPLLRSTQAIAQRVNALAAGKTIPEAPKELLHVLGAIDLGEAGSRRSPLLPLQPQLLEKLSQSEIEELTQLAADRHAYQLSFVPSIERAARGLNIAAVRSQLASMAQIVKVVPVSLPASGLSFLLLVVSSADPAELARIVECEREQVIELVAEQPVEAEPIEAEVSEPESDGATAADVLRVDVRRVDAAMDGLGELLVTKFRLRRALAKLEAKGVDVRELSEVVQDTERRIRDVRSMVLGLRMTSLSELLDRLPILVRGLQATTGKSARIELDVGRFEVDKVVGERLWPALVHLVRNAVDHGLETATERERLGKPARGTIRVSCARTASSRIILCIDDDGAGVDAERVARRAQRPTPKDASELLELMAQPGLSTRTDATKTSGRGMGLDIVRRIVVEELGGELRLNTTLGRGTRFLLEVPITVAVVDTFRCRSAAEQFLVPAANVEEFIDVDARSVVSGPSREQGTQGVRMLFSRGKVIPFVELGALIGLGGAERSSKAIIVRRDDEYFAFGVDQLLGHHEVVIRRLVDPLVNVAGVAGSADLGDGRPTLLLDLIALSRKLEEQAA
jgi:two-component system chemotaxis sensor kinase CheA